MKKKVSSIILLLVGIFLTSCSLNGRDSDDENKETWVAVGISYQKTYSTDEGLPAESKINSCHIVLFDEVGAFEKVVKLASPSTGKSDVFTIPIGKKRILAFVNSPNSLASYLENLGSNSNNTFGKVKEMSITLTVSGDVSSYASYVDNSNGNFTMTNSDCDRVYDLKYYETEADAKNAPVVIEVKRMVAKVDVKTRLTPSEGLLSLGEIEEVKTLVTCTNNSSYLFANVIDGIPQDVNFIRTDNTVATDYFKHSINDNSIWNNAKLVGSSSYSDPTYCLENTNRFLDQYEDNTTHLIVRVKFKPSELVSGTFWHDAQKGFSSTNNGGTLFSDGYMYYRVYFKHDRNVPPVNDLIYGVVRSYWYRVSITKFTSLGNPSYQLPIKEKIIGDGNVQASISIEPWNVIEQEVKM